MKIYILKNDEQLGPYEESKVLDMLEAGDLLPDDSAIRHGDKNWQKLRDYYPEVGKIAPKNIPLEETPPKKSRKGLLLGCGGFFMLAILVAGVLGFFAYRNLFPADSQEDLPDVVKDFKLANRYPPKGNVWGTQTNFVGIYENESKTQTIIYLMTVFNDESAAKDEMRAGLIQSCQSGETPMDFSFIDESGKEISQAATCAVPLYVVKDNRLVTLGGGGASGETFIEFAENLPFNKGTTMKKKVEN